MHVNNKSSEQEEEKISNGGGNEEDETLDSDTGMKLSAWIGNSHNG